MVGWAGGVDKLRIKLSQLSTKIEVEVEAELGNYQLNSWTDGHQMAKVCLSIKIGISMLDYFSLSSLSLTKKMSYNFCWSSDQILNPKKG